MGHLWRALAPRGVWIGFGAVLAMAGCSADDASTKRGSGGNAGAAGAAGSGAAGAAGAPAPGNDVDPEWPADEPLPPEFDFPPWVNMPEPRRIVVSWRTVDETTGTVRFGDTEAMEREVVSAESKNLHHADLGELAPATAYWYEVAIDGTSAIRSGVFVTPGRDRWRFVHFGEFHAANQIEHVAKFTDSIRAFRPHLLVESGDMVDDGNDLEDWRAYLRTSAPWIGNLIILPAGSNHVDGPGGNANLQDLFVLPHNERWYSTRYSQVQVLTLDSTRDLVNFDILDEEPDWVAEQTRLAHDGEDDPTFLVGAWHYPACSSQQKNRAGDRIWVQNAFIQTFKDNGGVDLVLVGHDKYYERSEIAGGIPHIQTNIGLIAPSDEVGNNHPDCTEIVTIRDTRSIALAEVDGANLSLRMVDEDDAELDRLDLAK